MNICTWFSQYPAVFSKQHAHTSSITIEAELLKERNQVGPVSVLLLLLHITPWTSYHKQLQALLKKKSKA